MKRNLVVGSALASASVVVVALVVPGIAFANEENNGHCNANRGTVSRLTSEVNQHSTRIGQLQDPRNNNRSDLNSERRALDAAKLQLLNENRRCHRPHPTPTTTTTTATETATETVENTTTVVHEVSGGVTVFERTVPVGSVNTGGA